MVPNLIQSLLLLGSVASLTAAAATPTKPRAIHMPVKMQKKKPVMKRSDVLGLDLINDWQHHLYAINVTIGTPGQTVELQLDTGSSDLWVFSPNACTEIDGSEAACGGSYDKSQSSSDQPTQPGVPFKISYMDDSHAEGDYITETISIGGAVVTGQTMAVAETGGPPLDRGLIGIGFANHESILQHGGKSFPSFMDQMTSQGVIPAKAYSLYLDDYLSSTGSIIFGGYDPSRYQGDLYVVPMVKTEQGGEVTETAVLWSSFGISDAAGSKVFPSSFLPTAALLDSGTAGLGLPTPYYNQVLSYMHATTDNNGNVAVDCKFSKMQSSLDFGFAGSDGPVISVPFSELVLPQGDGTCALVIGENDDPTSEIVFGDLFLRSAYVVYDLENKMIGLAPVIFDATDSSYVPFESNGVLSVPNKVIPTGGAPPVPSPDVGSGPQPTVYTARHLPTPQSDADRAKSQGSTSDAASLVFASGSIALAVVSGFFALVF